MFLCCVRESKTCGPDVIQRLFSSNLECNCLDKLTCTFACIYEVSVLDLFCTTLTLNNGKEYLLMLFPRFDTVKDVCFGGQSAQKGSVTRCLQAQ